MKILDAKNIIIDNYPFLLLNIDGKEALIGSFKFSTLNEGYIPLHSRDPNVDWTEILPEINISGSATPLRGFTEDPVILQMAISYWNAINELEGKTFIEGPVSIPQLGEMNAR